jgi:hypothetical protein
MPGCDNRQLGLLAIATPALAQGLSGATLQAYKTIDICDNGDGTWKFSGEVALYNIGSTDALGVTIHDCIQNKTGKGQFQSLPNYCQDISAGTIPANTPLGAALSFAYSIVGASLTGDIRNDAQTFLTNHAGGKTNGPDVKATWLGGQPPLCQHSGGGGCVLTQGFWKNHPEQWPAGYDPNALFFLSQLSWLNVLKTPDNASPGYYQLAHQYIAAVLNIANGASVPSGVQDTLNLALAWLQTNSQSACTASGSCGVQKDWAKVLDDYNNGIYPGGPAHCGE